MSNKPHIVIAAPGKGVGKGGVVRQMQYLAQEAQKHDDVKITWLSTHSNNTLWPIYFISTLLKFISLAITNKPNVIHLNIASKGSFWRKYILFRLANIFGIKHIAHLHGGGFEEFYNQASNSTKQRVKDLFSQASAVIVLGKKWHKFVEHLGVESEKINIIYNAVPTPKQPSTGSGEVPHIIFVGHLLPRKGVGELIDSLTELKDKQWKATFAGSGELERYKQQASAAGLSERINFASWLNDEELNSLYQQSDILVLPSHVENQPLSVLEAMAHGLAIICTNVGTVSEILDDNNAIVTELSQNNSELKEAISKLIDNAELRAKLGITARKDHINSFSLSGYYDNIIPLYKKSAE